jgi:hypothetical protein
MSHGAVGVRAAACGSRRQLLQHPCDLHRIRRSSKRGSSKHGGKKCARSDVPKIKSRRFGGTWQTGGGIPKRTALASLLWCQSLRLGHHSRHRTQLAEDAIYCARHMLTTAKTGGRRSVADSRIPLARSACRAGRRA